MRVGILSLIVGGVLTLGLGPVGAATLPAGAPLTDAVVEALVQDALDGDGAGEQFRLSIDQPALPMGNQGGAATEIELEEFDYDPQQRRFRAVLAGTVDGTDRFRLPVAGRVQELTSVPVLVRALAPGELVTAADLDWIEIRADRVRPTTLATAAEVVGAEARRRLAPGRVLTTRDLGAARLVHRGRPVRLLYQRPGLQVSAVGIAQEDGALGALVRVLNPDSRRQLQGVVTGPDQVALDAGPGLSR